MPRITISARRNPDTPLAQRYDYPAVRLHWLLLCIVVAIGTAAALIWLAVAHS